MPPVTLLCIHLNHRSCYDSRQYTTVRDETTTTTAILAAHYDCPMSPVIEFPCVSQSPLFTNRRLTRKIKVLFAFTCAGSWSEAECQAAERSTAAWRCAEKTEINDTVYRGR